MITPSSNAPCFFALRDHGYKVLMTGEVNGAIKVNRAEQPDLILLDLSFPVDASNIGGPAQDGFFFIEWIRRTPEVERIPIMIISSSEPESYKDRAAAAGILACFQKPLDKAALVTAVQRTITEIKRVICQKPPDS